MKENINISVAMATYNGEKYLKEQIDSILKNLTDSDELIISDDGSTDQTSSIVKEYQKKYSQIKLIEGPKNGIKQNFVNAISHCKGKYIFLSDQDDIWLENKVNSILPLFLENDLVVHDCIIVDSSLNEIEPSFFEYRGSGKGIFKNIYKNTYIGCCMAFKRELVEFILPIPNNIEMHDQWIGIITEKTKKKVNFLQEKLIKYRRHEENNSQMKHYPFFKMLKNRIIFIIELKRRKK